MSQDRTVSELVAGTTEVRKVARQLLLELFVFVALGLVAAICEFGIEPFHRGFFCDDETIRYPFLPNTVTPLMLGLLIGLLPVLVISGIEFSRFYRSKQLSDMCTLCGYRMPLWLVACVEQFVYFLFGMAITFDATEVGKYTIGRLRPHFLAVCQPQFADGSTCADQQNRYRYVEEYICQSYDYTAADVRQGRLSFPSGHSSLAFFAMVYIAFYIQHRFTWRNAKLFCHFLQFGLFMLAWFTALSRVMDNWHHWSDVLCGSLIGVLCALLTAFYIAKMHNWTDESSLRRGLPRQDTTTTLQEMIITPPPYTIGTVDNFSNEQYCTKV